MLHRLLSLILILSFYTFKESAAENPPSTVTVGAYINNIQAIDLKSHSYAADLYVWFRWNDEELNPASTIEFINPTELWGHTLRPSYETPKKLASGELYQVIRLEGRFSQKFDLSRYPLDSQALEAVFEDNVHGSNRVSYVLDQEPIVLNPELKLPGFFLSTPSISVQQSSYPSNFGDRSTQRDKYSRVKISLPIQRPKMTYVLKLFVPLLCVLLCAGLICFLSVEWVDARIGMGITAILSLVALQITLNDELPEVDYLTLIDRFYLGAYILIIFCIAAAIYSTAKGKTASHLLIMQREKKLFLVAFTGYLAYSAILLFGCK